MAKRQRAKRVGKRGAHEGTIFQRKDGRWVAALNIGRTASGKRIRKVAYRRTQAEAIKARDDLKAKFKGVRPDDAGNLTLSQYSEVWLADIEHELKPRTVASYRQHLRVYVLPVLGKCKLEEIRARDVRGLVKGLRQEGYSKNTARLARAVLSAMFSDAVEDGYVTANPALAARNGRRKRAQGMTSEDRIELIRPFDEHELVRFLETARETDADYYPLFLLLARTGMRPGEAYALRWTKVDFVSREILVDRALSGRKIGTPKNGKSRRVDVSLELVDTLKRLYAERELEGVQANGLIERSDTVFSNGAGGMLDESRARKHFAEAMRLAGLSGHRLYDLRHTFATIHLARGTPLPYVAAQLGHANPATTLRFYARWIPRADKSYADALDSRRFTAQTISPNAPLVAVNAAINEPEPPLTEERISSPSPLFAEELRGGPSETRTPDPLIKSLLTQHLLTSCETS